MTTRWRAGEVVVRREVWRGRVWSGVPVVVVEDRADLLAVHLPEGSPFGFPDGDWPGGRHPWHGHAAWTGHGTLMLHRPADAYAVWVFWSSSARDFSCWYVNFQAPYRRTPIGFDTLDHELDLLSREGERWEWKDEDLLERCVETGRFTRDEADAILAYARRVEAQLRHDGPWWDPAWAEWRPEATPPLSLPRGWDAVSSP